MIAGTIPMPTNSGYRFFCGHRAPPTLMPITMSTHAVITLPRNDLKSRIIVFLFAAESR